MKNITLLLSAILILSINIQAQKKDKNSTGWKYNEGDKDNFEYVEESTMGYENLPKKARHYFESIVYIKGGTYSSYPYSKINATEKDSTLIINEIARRITVSSFFISQYEVTNIEYREFTDWVKTKTAMDILAKLYPKYRNEDGTYKETITVDWNDSLLQKELYHPSEEEFYKRKAINEKLLIFDSIPIYPDTLCWVNNLSYSYNEPMVRLYNWHPAYDSYPVVGVSWKQANAYCKWRTDRLNEDILIAEGVLEKHSYYFSSDKYSKENENNRMEDGLLYPNFRLPTEAEWEYAAIYKQNESKKNTDYKTYNYPWDNNELIDNKGKYKANFGQIIDVNGFISKKYDDDDFFYTNPVKSFQANNFKLFGMSGNVAEWVMDIISTKRNDYNYKIDEFKGLGDEDTYKETKEHPDSINIYSEEKSEYIIVKINSENHKKIIAKNDSIYESSEVYIRPHFLDVVTNDKETKLKKIILHNNKIIEKNQPARVVKGGSWADGPVYILPSTKTIFNENESSSRIGFRVAMYKVGGSISK